MKTTTKFLSQVLYAAIFNSWCVILKVPAFEINNALVQKYFLAANTMSRSLPSQNLQQTALFSSFSSSNPRMTTNGETSSSRTPENGAADSSSLLPAIEGVKGGRSVGSYSPSKKESGSGSRAKDVNKPPDEEFESAPKKSKDPKKSQKKPKVPESAEDSVSMETGFQSKPAIQGGRMLSRPNKKVQKEDKKPPKVSKVSRQEDSEDSSSEENSKTEVKVNQEHGQSSKQEQINENIEELIPISQNLPMMSRVKNKKTQRQQVTQFQRQQTQFPVNINPQSFPIQNFLPMQLFG